MITDPSHFGNLSLESDAMMRRLEEERRNAAGPWAGPWEPYGDVPEYPVGAERSPEPAFWVPWTFREIREGVAARRQWHTFNVNGHRQTGLFTPEQVDRLHATGQDPRPTMEPDTAARDLGAWLPQEA